MRPNHMGFRVLGRVGGSRVQGLGFRLGFGFRVLGLGFSG